MNNILIMRLVFKQNEHFVLFFKEFRVFKSKLFNCSFSKLNTEKSRMLIYENSEIQF